MQYPLSGNANTPGGIAILSVYSNPSSIIAASCRLSFDTILILMPEWSINPYDAPRDDGIKIDRQTGW